jgi:hypothetical protein
MGRMAHTREGLDGDSRFSSEFTKAFWVARLVLEVEAVIFHCSKTIALCEAFCRRRHRILPIITQACMDKTTPSWYLTVDQLDIYTRGNKTAGYE